MTTSETLEGLYISCDLTFELYEYLMLSTSHIQLPRNNIGSSTSIRLHHKRLAGVRTMTGMFHPGSKAPVNFPESSLVIPYPSSDAGPIQHFCAALVLQLPSPKPPTQAYISFYDYSKLFHEDAATSKPPVAYPTLPNINQRTYYTPGNSRVIYLANPVAIEKLIFKG